MLSVDPLSPLDAWRLAQERGILPSSLGTAELRAEFTAEMRRRAVFSARTTSAEYLSEIKTVVDALAAGDYSDGEGRLIMGEMLDALGYTPERSFPGDAIGEGPGEVPEAVAGTLQDLRTFRRLDLILRTQTSLMRNAGLLERGMEPARRRVFPWWELVRVGTREEPRDWPGRWEESGGTLVAGNRMIAEKGAAIWARLGSSAAYDDALDTAHPPFAFLSGMGWREVDRATGEELGLPAPAPREDRAQPAPTGLPAATASLGAADQALVDRLAADLRVHREANGRLTLESILTTPDPDPESR